MARYTATVEQIADLNGTPIVGAKKFFFEPGTTIKKTIYSDSGFSVPTLNPQTSDSDGRFSGEIFLDGIYDEIQQDNAGTPNSFDGNTLWGPKLTGEGLSGAMSAWVSDTIYNIPDKVTGSNDLSYESLTDSNQGNDPISSPSNWATITFVKAGVLDGVTTIKDSNSNEALIITPTSSAVNGFEIVNAATGVNPTIKSEGEANTGIIVADSNSNEIIVLESVATAVNGIKVTNAATGNQAKIQGDGEAAGAGLIIEGLGTNSTIDIISTGTGDINLTPSTGAVNVRATPIYGIILLNTPVLLATDTSISATGNTPVDITAQTTGVAVKVILSIYMYGQAATAAGTSEVVVGEGGETLTTLIHRALFSDRKLSAEEIQGSTQVTVNLAAGEIFDYAILQTGTAPISRTVKVYLAGYYI